MWLNGDSNDRFNELRVSGDFIWSRHRVRDGVRGVEINDHDSRRCRITCRFDLGFWLSALRFD